MEDQSMLKGTSGADTQEGINEYANELIKEVCLNGDTFSKYQKQIEKRFGTDFYEKCDEYPCLNRGGSNSGCRGGRRLLCL